MTEKIIWYDKKRWKHRFFQFGQRKAEIDERGLLPLYDCRNVSGDGGTCGYACHDDTGGYLGKVHGALQAVNTKLFSAWLQENQEYDIAANMYIVWYTPDEDEVMLIMEVRYGFL
ncbi:hypothetical protein CIAN88_16315 [[Clostridium] innocuum]|uniref:Uncharacterized protein n=1 Tax=Clostridium innocuum TaxID=1522 RepID=A0A099I3P1_CLOIN|nr:hypothetical protein CIAN88_16315 [[Clostridium] innocuum]